MANVTAKYSVLKRKYNQKEEENLSLREQIREFECNRCNSSGVSQAVMTRLEMERDAAKGDCVRLREENNALRDDMQRLKECQRCDQTRLEQAKKDFDSCVAQFEVERRGLTAETERVNEELRQARERVRQLQAEATDQRTRCNHLKMVSEQTERELQTTQDLLHQSEAELASALDRIQELTEETQRLQWEIKEARQERNSFKANLARLDQEKDALLLKVDEKTEQAVRVEAELESRDRRIASLEGFIADLQRKLDVALDTAARSEQSTRQHTLETDRLKKELEKMERCRDLAVKENSRLQDDLAAVSKDYQQTSRSLETSRREVEDLKLQLQGYVAEVRRITQILEEKEVERMAMLEHYRSLTVESANLETNNHSLESEARSTKSCLREAQTKIQDLEASLAEKKALVQGYEKQIKELTQQVAKLERKLEKLSRTENTSRDLSRELESQKHCLAQKVEQLMEDNKQLEEEVRHLRSELSRTQDLLGKERKNSVTLENVLASSRQETLLRSRDNSELKAQVQCLQTKLQELQDKLEHGTEALRRCQSQCSDYQSQVAELQREVTNERFERARIEETRRRSRQTRRLKKHLVPVRSRSLTSLHTLLMAPTFVCPCCFLNRISSLRNSPETSSEVVNDSYDCRLDTDAKHKFISSNQFLEKSASKRPEWLTSRSFREDNKNLSKNVLICSETSTLATDSSSMTYKIDDNNLSEESEEFMLPERLTSNSGRPKSSDTYTIGVPEKKMTTGVEIPLSSNSSFDTFSHTEIIAEQIDYMLQEQKRFLKEMDLPIRGDGGFRLEGDQLLELQPVPIGNSKSKMKKGQKNKKDSNKKLKIDKSRTDRIVFYGSGDQGNIPRLNKGRNSKKILNKDIPSESKVKENKKINNIPIVHFNEEPIKLTKNVKWMLPDQSENDLNKDSSKNKNSSVKMLFFPESGMQCSTSSLDSQGSKSVYVTAANSYTDTYKDSIPAVYAMADSSSEASVGAIVDSGSRTSVRAFVDSFSSPNLTVVVDSISSTSVRGVIDSTSNVSIKGAVDSSSSLLGVVDSTSNI